MDDPTFLNAMITGPVARVVAGVWGALWGSFVNVLILRLPAGESLVRPGSHCRSCGASVAWYDNVPIFAYLWLRGRCRRCGARFSPRYALVELLVALLAVAMHQVYVVGASGPPEVRAAQFVITSLFAALLVAIAFIDLDTMLILNVITYPGIPVAMACSLLMGHQHLWDGAVGGVAGYLVIRLLSDGWRLLRGHQGMGYGDAKLLAMIGGLLGWQSLIPVLFLAALQGSVIGVGALLLARRRSLAPPVAPANDVPPAPAPSGEEAPPAEAAGPGDRAAARPGDHADGEHGEDEEGEEDEPYQGPPRIPFGPFLGLAAVEVMLARDLLTQLLQVYF